MTIEDEMKQAQFFEGDIDLETATLDGVQYVREHDGTWRYADSWLRVPGARDLTLTERFEPDVIVSANNKVERVVIPRRDIDEAPELLDWCVAVGRAVTDDDGEIIEIFVPVKDWDEHDRIPGEIYVPEVRGSVAERELAEAEREYREAEQLLEKASENRADVLRRWSGEMTRQEARAITGLSVGRIQQLIRAKRFEPFELEILRLFQESGSIKTFDAFRAKVKERELPNDPDALKTVVSDLESRGYLEQGSKGGVILSDEGAQMLYTVDLAEEEARPKGDEE